MSILLRCLTSNITETMSYNQFDSRHMKKLKKKFRIRPSLVKLKQFDKRQLPSCKLCNSIFLTHHALVSHNCTTETNLDSCTRRCTYCDMTFESLSFLKFHISKKHKKNSNGVKLKTKEEGIFSCGQCDFKSGHLLYLNKHINEWHLTEGEKLKETIELLPPADPKTPIKLPTPKPATNSSPPAKQEKLQCRFCKTCFKHRNNFLQHMATHKIPLRCRYCRASCKTRASFKLHVITHYKIEHPPKCPICNKLFTKPTNARQHMGIHSLETLEEKVSLFKPKILVERPILNQKAMTTLFNAQETNQTKGPEKVFAAPAENYMDLKCDLCGSFFGHVKSLKNHQLEKHPNRKIVCKVCQKVFFSINSLRSHQKIHQPQAKIDTKENGTMTENLKRNKGYQTDECSTSSAETQTPKWPKRKKIKIIFSPAPQIECVDDLNIVNPVNVEKLTELMDIPCYSSHIGF